MYRKVQALTYLAYLTVLLTLHLVDFTATIYMIGLGYVESNPVTSLFINSVPLSILFFIASVGILVLFSYLLFNLYYRSSGMVKALYKLCIATFILHKSLFVVNNLMVMYFNKPLLSIIYATIL